MILGGRMNEVHPHASQQRENGHVAIVARFSVSQISFERMIPLPLCVCA